MLPRRNTNFKARRHNNRDEIVTEYLERAVSLERLVANEQESQFEKALLSQAEAYRKLAARRAEVYGLPPPSPPEISKPLN